ncbi:MAG: transglutaminase-like domain-containing protein [Desulfobacterota bacterium]|nr:transglutaminase-like domain-containing protein [Thermodesulfobacteriota bacterium]MDW8002226.1 transglutaminase-like domain-containing protein [Deltaproteobacteria bacterium]
MEKDLEIYLKPTEIIDSNNPLIVETSQKIKGNLKDPVEIAKKLFLYVRDTIIYDPYTPFFLPEHYKASIVLKRKRGFCIPKASLLCALSRASNIPTRVGFATVRNHLATPQLIEFLGSDLFPYHAYVEFYLNGIWVKATPAFNKELCEKFRVPPLEFDGRNDAIFQPYNLEQKKFMEYVEFLGVYSDIPVERIVEGFKKAYGSERVDLWIKTYLEKGYIREPFEKEVESFVSFF